MKLIDKLEKKVQERYLKRLRKKEKTYSLLLVSAKQHFNDCNIEELENARMILDEEIIKFKEDDFPTIGVPIIVSLFVLSVTILITYLGTKGLNNDIIYNLFSYINNWSWAYFVFLIILLLYLTQRKIKKIAILTRLQNIVNIKIAQKNKKISKNQ